MNQEAFLGILSFFWGIQKVFVGIFFDFSESAQCLFSVFECFYFLFFISSTGPPPSTGPAKISLGLPPSLPPHPPLPPRPFRAPPFWAPFGPHLDPHFFWVCRPTPFGSRCCCFCFVVGCINILSQKTECQRSLDNPQSWRICISCGRWFSKIIRIPRPHTETGIPP